MKRLIHIVTLLCTFIAFGAVPNAGCNQPVTKITSDSPLALHCPGGGWCDRRNETCGANGTCVYVGESDRAFGSNKLDAGVDR